MDISSDRPSAEVVDVVVAGEIDMDTIDALRRATIDAIRTAGVHDVRMDLTGVTFCDSSGVALFDEAHHVAAGLGIRFRLVGVRPAVGRVLEIMGLMEPLTAPVNP